MKFVSDSNINPHQILSSTLLAYGSGCPDTIANSLTDTQALDLNSVILAAYHGGYNKAMDELLTKKSKK